MKRIFTLILFSIIAFNAIHAEITWTLSNDGTLTISGTGDMGYYEDNPAPWNGQGIIKKVIITNGVTSIGGYAFSSIGLTLTSVSIPKSVTRIYEGAFSGCTKLTSVTIPKSVTYIDDGAFSGCTNLTSISLPNSITSINERVFADCTNLTSITIPNSVKTIGRYAFNRSGLTSITIPNSITSIGGAAFSGCLGLTSITIPNSVTSIGSNPFEDCTNLTSINVESENAYYDSRNDCDAIIRKSDNTLVSGCEYTDIPNNVTSIGSAAFSGCQNLTSIIIPNSVTNIGWTAFSGCKNLTSINIPNSVTSIGEDAFAGSGLTSIIIPNSVTSIGEYAFGACSSLKSVTINVNKYLRIEYDCFRCSPEKIILSGKTLPAYTNCYGEFPYNATLYVPSSLYEDYKSSSPWGNFKKIERWVDSPASLSDGETYINTIPSDNAEVSYTRNFDNTSWQALYIPFSMSYDDWKEDFEVAHINSIHQYDKDDDGIIDETVMEVVKIKNGSLIPNTPYLIRAKTTGEKTITVTNSTLCKSEENSIECSTMLAKYTFKGTYKPILAYTLIKNNYYAMGGGSLIMTDGSSGLKPYRWYLKIDARSPMYNVSNGAKTITINVVGEEETTGITNSQHLSPNDHIYDLNGRRVNQNNLKPGIYVKNGKKIIIK